jgi:archaellum component FlaC
MSRFAYYAIPLVLSLNACQTSEPDKGASTGKTVDQAAAEVGATITNLDATVAALNELVERPAPDLNPQFKTYTTNLGMLETSAGKVRDLAATMDTKSQEYFLQWDTQIATVQDEDIRERSEDRKKTIEANFNKIKNEYAEVRNEFKPLLADLQDKTVKKVDDESKDVKESLQEMEKRFHDLGVKLSRTGPAPAPPKQ